MTRDQIQAWRDAAVADGWSIKPTYENHEPAETAASLERDGWKAMTLLRPYPVQPSLSVWGPDRLAVHPSYLYDWQALQALLRKCLHCGATDVETRRVGFADRVCATCLPAQRELQEYRGWAE